MTLVIKVRDIYHDENDDMSISEIEQRISNSLTHKSIANVRISKGNKNSPLFLEVEDSVNYISLNTAQEIASRAVEEFAAVESSIDLDHSTRKDNILVASKR